MASVWGETLVARCGWNQLLPLSSVIFWGSLDGFGTLLVVVVVVLGNWLNWLFLSKVPVGHWMAQKPALAAASLDSSPMLISSTFGDSAPQTPPLALGGPGGQADCHRRASVEIAGGRIGLFSRIRSSSSITAVDRRGSSYGNMKKPKLYIGISLLPKLDISVIVVF